MTLKSLLLSTLLVVVTAVLTGGIYWMLLNVPESNVLALALSALLALLLVVVGGYGLAVTLSVAAGSSVGRAMRDGVRGMPGLLCGVALFIVLAFVTGAIEGSWVEHGGEIDALFLRYAGTANSGWIHPTVAWVLWLMRWGIGGALVIGATVGGALRGTIRRGLGLAFAPRPLGATLVALLGAYAMWALVYWRPAGLPADTAEVAFVSVKLSLLFLGYVVITTLVLHVFARAATPQAAGTAPVSSPL